MAPEAHPVLTNCCVRDSERVLMLAEGPVDSDDLETLCGGSCC